MKGFTFVVLAVLAAVGVGIGVESTVPPPPIRGPFASFGNDVGYFAAGQPRSVSAQWKVPTVLDQSAAGDAVTWVGIEGDSAHFIQIGTIEYRGQIGRYTTETTYLTFWSDVRHGFLPQFLGETQPGHLIQASITKASGGWNIKIDDLNQPGPAKSMIVRDPTSGFNATDWVQEDPIKLHSNGGFESYPALSTVQFDNLRINGDRPHLSLDHSVWLTTGGQNYAPNPLGNDAFDINLVHLDRPQLQFLADVAPVFAAAENADIKLDTLRTALSNREQTAALAPYFAAVARLGSRILSQAWPTNALPVLQKLASDSRVYAAIESETSPAASRAIEVTNDDDVAARLALGLPQGARTAYDVSVSVNHK